MYKKTQKNDNFKQKKRKTVVVRLILGCCVVVCGVLFGVSYFAPSTTTSAQKEKQTTRLILIRGLEDVTQTTPKDSCTEADAEPFNNQQQGAGNLDFLRTTTSNFCSNTDQDWFSLLVQNEPYEFTIETFDSKSYAFPVFEVYNSKGKIGQSVKQDNNKESRYSFIPKNFFPQGAPENQAETMYIRVTNDVINFPNTIDTKLSTYSIRIAKTSQENSENADEFEPDNLKSPVEISQLNTDGTTQQRNFHNKLDIDWIKIFIGFPQKEYTVETSVPPGKKGDTVLELYPPTLDLTNPSLTSPLLTNDNKTIADLGSKITFRPESLGFTGQTYVFYLKVYPKNNQENTGPSASYTIKASYPEDVNDSNTPTPKPVNGDAEEPNNSVSQAKEIVVGEEKNNLDFHDSTDSDWFKFWPPYNEELYAIRTSNLGSKADTVLKLYAPNGTTLLATNDNINDRTKASEILFIPKNYNGNDSYYYLLVQPKNAAINTGQKTQYTIGIKSMDEATPTPSVRDGDAYEPNESIEQAKELYAEMGARGLNFHSSGDVDWFKFWAPFGERSYLITTENLGVKADTVLTLFDADKKKIIQSNDNSSPNTKASSIRFIPDNYSGSEMYFLRIQPKNSTINTGINTEYDIVITTGQEITATPTIENVPGYDQYEIDNPAILSKEILPNEAGQQHSFHRDDEDWVHFYVNLPHFTYTITTQAIGKKCDTVMELYASDRKTLLLENDNATADSTGSSLTFIPSNYAGSDYYYVRIRPKNPQANVGGASEYLLSLVHEVIPTPTPGDPETIEPDIFESDDYPEYASWIPDISVNAPEHTLHNKNDIDWYVFTITMTGRYRIYVNNSVELYLYNSSQEGHLATNNPDDQVSNKEITTKTPTENGTQTGAGKDEIESRELSQQNEGGVRAEKQDRDDNIVRGLNIETISISSMLEYNFYYPGTYYLSVQPRGENFKPIKSNYTVRITSLLPPTAPPSTIDDRLAVPDGFDKAVEFGDNLPEASRPFWTGWEKHTHSLHNLDDQDWKFFFLTQPQNVSFRINNPTKQKMLFKLFRVFNNKCIVRRYDNRYSSPYNPETNSTPSCIKESPETGIFEWVPWGKIPYPESNIFVNTEVLKNIVVEQENFIFQHNLPITGVYYAGITNLDNSLGKYYELLIQTEKELQQMNDFWDQWLPVDNSLQTASYIMADGVEQKHTLPIITDQDWMTFHGAKGVEYHIKFFSKPRIKVSLFEKTATGLATHRQAMFSGEYEMIFKPQNDDNYYIHVTYGDETLYAPQDSEDTVFYVKVRSSFYNQVAPEVPGEEQRKNWSVVLPTITPTPKPIDKISIKKEALSREVVAGKEIDYTITLVNSNDHDVVVDLRDQLPQGTIFLYESEETQAPTEDKEKKILSWKDNILKKGEQRRWEYKVRVPEEMKDISLTNKACVQLRQTEGVTEVQEACSEYKVIVMTPTMSPTLTLTPTFTPTVTPNMTIKKYANMKEVVTGETVLFTVEISNADFVTRDVTVKDILPPSLNFKQMIKGKMPVITTATATATVSSTGQITTATSTLTATLSATSTSTVLLTSTPTPTNIATKTPNPQGRGVESTLSEDEIRDERKGMDIVPYHDEEPLIAMDAETGEKILQWNLTLRESTRVSIQYEVLVESGTTLSTLTNRACLLYQQAEICSHSTISAFSPTPTNTIHPFFKTPNTFSNRLHVLVLYDDSIPTVQPTKNKNDTSNNNGDTENNSSSEGELWDNFATATFTPTPKESPVDNNQDQNTNETENKQNNTTIDQGTRKALFLENKQQQGKPLQGVPITISTYGKTQYTDINGVAVFENVNPNLYTVFARFQGEVRYTDVDTTNQRYALIIFRPQFVGKSAGGATLNESTIKDENNTRRNETLPETGLNVPLLAYIMLTFLTVTMWEAKMYHQIFSILLKIWFQEKLSSCCKLFSKK